MKHVPVSAELNIRLNELVSILSGIEQREHAKKWQTPAERWCWKDCAKYVHINTRRHTDTVGHSGAFLVDKQTGELYNIKSYGVPDHNKKAKSDIGNVFTVDPEFLWSKRHNYLR